MGLTSGSVGRASLDCDARIERRAQKDQIVAIAGNPNVGKSTIFNALTGMNQHTGNWPGKTVANAKGICKTQRHAYVLVDIPGTYSLMAHSPEEEVARNFICFGRPDAVIVVCDATCLERNLNLALQVLEISRKAILCVNLVDEAQRKQITVRLDALSKRLGIPVVATVARKRATLQALLDALDDRIDGPERTPLRIDYPEPVERAIARLEPLVARKAGPMVSYRWLSMRLMDGDEALFEEMRKFLGVDLAADPEIQRAIEEVWSEIGWTREAWKDAVVTGIVRRAEEISRAVVERRAKGYSDRDRRIDRALTSRHTAYPVMALLLAGILWLTIVGANGLSDRLSDALFWVQDLLSALILRIGAPQWLHDMLVLGIYRVLAWVVSVMLPPMAIFFPLFTLLEDAGYLPRVAYVLDRPFRRCRACGKQALTMCMGFGCNAAGVVGCRIIDSPRERLIAILTNSFVPCNGRFPMLIAIIAMFFPLAGGAWLGSMGSALLLALLILVGVGMTFAASWLLGVTLLRGVSSSFTLELPPFRRPQIGRVIVRSVFDRTLFVLGRAAAVAAPAGLVIWLMANVSIGGNSLLGHCAGFLDPFARVLGLDGILLMAFILGFPANEIVIPTAVMGYLAQGSLQSVPDVQQMRQLFLANGWTGTTALCTLLFSIFHWPCSTTLLTIRKETGSWKWTAVAFALPTAIGMALCSMVAMVF